MSPAGSIVLLEDGDLKSQKDLIPIPETSLEEVKAMNRKDRRQWYRDNKLKWETLQASEVLEHTDTTDDADDEGYF